MGKRQFLSLERKIELAKKGRTILSSGEGSLRQLCRANKVQGNQLRRYIKQLSMMEARLNGTSRGTAYLQTLNNGRPNSLTAVEKPLLEWFLQLRHGGDACLNEYGNP